MNNTIIKKGNDFEVIKPATGRPQGSRVAYIDGRNFTAAETLAQINEAPVLVLKKPEGMTDEAIGKLKGEIQKHLSEGRPLVLNTSDPAEIKFISIDEANRLTKPKPAIWIEEAGPLNPEGLEALAEGLKKRHERERREGLGNALKALSQNKIKNTPRTSQEDPGPTNAEDRTKAPAKAFKSIKPRENRGPNSKKIF